MFFAPILRDKPSIANLDLLRDALLENIPPQGGLCTLIMAIDDHAVAKLLGRFCSHLATRDVTLHALFYGADRSPLTELFERFETAYGHGKFAARCRVLPQLPGGLRLTMMAMRQGFLWTAQTSKGPVSTLPSISFHHPSIELALATMRINYAEATPCNITVNGSKLAA